MSTTLKILCSVLLCLAATELTICQTLDPTPVPPLPAPPVPPPPSIPSDIRLPVSAPAPDLSIVEPEVCDFYKGEESFPVVGNVKYEIWRRKPLKELRLTGNTFSASAHAYYFVDAGLLAQCGWDDEPAREVEVGIDSKIKWGRQWSLESTTTVRPFRCPLSDPNDLTCRCRLTTANIDVTDRIYNIGQRVLQRGVAKFDERLKQLSSFQDDAARFWGKLQEPIDIGGGRRWLVIQPISVSAGPIAASNTTPQTIDTVFGLTANPKIILGDKPTPVINPLPDLEVVPDPTGFHVSTDVEVSFDEATRLLQDPQTGVIGKTFTSGRRELKIVGARMYGTREKIAVELKVEGRAIKGNIPKIVDVVTFFESSFKRIRYLFEKKFYKLKGTVYLTGTPNYSMGDRVITFPDLEYDLETKNVIAKVANWILKTSLTERLRADVKVPLGDKLDTLKDNLSTNLNRPIGDNARLSGRVDSLRVEMVFVGDNHLKGRIVLDGNAELIVDWR